MLNGAAYRTEALADDEAARLRLSYRAMLALTTLCVLGTLATGTLALPPESVGEAVFLATVLLLALAGSGLFILFTGETRRDIGAGVKIVARGRIAELARRDSSAGPRWSVRVGGTWISDPLLPAASTPMSALYVGQLVDTAYLPHSLRTLYVRPVASTGADGLSLS